MKTHSYYHFSQFSKVKSKDLFRKLSAVHFDDYRCMQVQYACLHAQKEFMQGLYTGCFISKYMQLSCMSCFSFWYGLTLVLTRGVESTPPSPPRNSQTSALLGLKKCLQEFYSNDG